MDALSNFLSATKSGQVETEEGAELPVGELNWEAEFKLDSRLSQLELAKLWQGIFYCKHLSSRAHIGSRIERQH